jgi:hypothetical protein
MITELSISGVVLSSVFAIALSAVFIMLGTENTSESTSNSASGSLEPVSLRLFGILSVALISASQKIDHIPVLVFVGLARCAFWAAVDFLVSDDTNNPLIIRLPLTMPQSVH